MTEEGAGTTPDEENGFGLRNKVGKLGGKGLVWLDGLDSPDSQVRDL